MEQTMKVQNVTLQSSSRVIEAITRHSPEYLMEAFGLALFMFTAGAFGVPLEHPASPVREMIASSTERRVLFGSGMGATAILNIYSPWGKRSGAHLNPATTLTFWRL